VVSRSLKPDEPHDWTRDATSLGTCEAKETVEVVADHEDGTRCRREWSRQPDRCGFGHVAEWARARRDSEEATLVNFERGRNEVFGLRSVPVV
jgi:hypothetical protein